MNVDRKRRRFPIKKTHGLLSDEVQWEKSPLTWDYRRWRRSWRSWRESSPNPIQMQMFWMSSAQLAHHIPFPNDDAQRRGGTTSTFEQP